MPDVVIENPILNSPYTEPTRHFRFVEEGITDEIIEERRPSSYFIPIPKPKKKGRQLTLETEWTEDRLRENAMINQIREHIGRWRVRVTGPFTVESLSPHRVLPADEDQDGIVSPREAERQQDFATIILDNLRVAGVQNTRKNERLRFETLDPFPGRWLQATGTYREEDGTQRRVAISLGPEHGTVGPEQVKEAAKEAVQGLGFDVLVVCGFAFDPHVGEETKKYGRLTVLPARMNPDLAMGGDLLKKTGSGNLFTVFGEPDLEVQPQPDGTITIRLRGVDVYDPTTGDVRSSDGTSDIACWFIDTDYDGESFFVRHAYFTGEGAPYDKLKRALRAEIDEGAWSALYRTESRPFTRPKRRQIAVKVINHYGDEVLKVFGV